MPHEPHEFSASMIATGHEPILPPDLQHDACASPSVGEPTTYAEVLKQRLKLTDQQVAAPPPPTTTNSYQEGSLIFAMTTPPERSNKLMPRWKGPFRVKKIPNPYQVVYEDGSAWRTVHINHTKPAKLAARDLPVPTSAPEPPLPVLGYLPSGLVHPRPLRSSPPLPAAAPAERLPGSPAASVPAPAAASPLASKKPPIEATSTNRKRAPSPRPSSHPTNRKQLPAPAPANQNSESVLRQRRSARLNPGLDQACAIKSPSRPLAPQSQPSTEMARTYPLSLGYNQCLGAKEDPYSFYSLYLEDLHNRDQKYLTTIEQLVDALPRTTDPASHFALRGHVTPHGHERLRHSMRAALWWLLPSDGKLRRAPHALHFYLAGQGRRVVLRGGNMTQPFYESHLHWVPDPSPATPRRLDDLTSPAAVAADPTSPAEAHPRLPGRSRRRRRRKKKAAASANRNSASCCADLATPPTRSTNNNSTRCKGTRPGSRTNQLPARPPGTKSTVKHPSSFTSSPVTQHPISLANENSERTYRWDHPERLAVNKPAQTSPSQDLTATLSRDNTPGFGLSSTALQQPSTKPFSGLPSRRLMTSPFREDGEAVRERPGIVYPVAAPRCSSRHVPAD